MLTGNYKRTIDKGRVAIPNCLLVKMFPDETQDRKLYIIDSNTNGSNTNFCILSEEELKKIIEQKSKELNESEYSNYMAKFLSIVFEVDVDNQNRILLPTCVKEKLGDKEVVITGAGSILRVWPDVRYQEAMKQFCLDNQKAMESVYLDNQKASHVLILCD